MGALRGTDGRLSQGGDFTGTPLIQGNVAQSATSATIDGTGLNGVIRPGDTFTVAGDGQTYTIVTGGVIGSVTPNELDITFSPGVVPGGGWADNSEVTFASNKVAQVTRWEAEPERPFLDTTVMGDSAESGTLDIATWRGTAEALLDYGDDQQKALIDQIVAGAVPTALALTLVATVGKQFWGDVLAENFRIGLRRGAIVPISFSFEGTGAIGVNWN